MIVAGCDVGSLTSKAVILKEGRILGSCVIPSRGKPSRSAEKVMNGALEQAKTRMEDIAYCVGTGYGRESIPFVREAVSEISCHGKGAKWLVPSVTTIIDIGGQDCKVIKVDKEGKPTRFIANDKCASGTGRFLEVLARVLDVEMDDLGKLSEKSRSPVTFASTCTVWAQADVIKHINDGVALEDIGAGINNAMANRVAMLVGSLKVEPDVCMTGGVAKNTGVVRAMEKLLGVRIKKARKADPQLAGAIGAALLAQEKMKKA